MANEKKTKEWLTKWAQRLIKGKRYWIPAAGWCLFLGFVNNCIVWPFADIKLVEWSELLTALGIMLTISGGRDWLLDKQSPTSTKTVVVEGVETERATVGKRYWIPAIGWCLAFAILNNCGLFPYFEVKIVEWDQVLIGMGVLLGISATRDWLLKKNKEDAEAAAEEKRRADTERKATEEPVSDER